MEHHVRFQRQIGHVQHRLADDVHIHQGFNRHLTIGLHNAGRHALGHLGCGIANVDLPDSDVVFATVERRCLGQARDGVFGRRVGNRIGARRGGRNRTVVNDAPAPRRLRLHHPKRLLNAQKHAGEVDVYHIFPLRQRQVFQGNTGCIDPGIVEQHIDPPECAHRGIKQRLHRISVRHIGRHGQHHPVAVCKLAERSQIAAQEIGELASGSVEKAESAGKLLDEIVPAVSKTSDLVQEIAAASSEQSSGVGQINTAMGQLNQITQQNASASEELAATAEEMSGQAMQLQELMAFFKVDASATPAAKAPIAARAVPKKAARAGEQGRGFAVVASEVRSLAGRSAEAAKEIKGLINASVERVEQGCVLVDQAGTTMTEVVSSIKRVTDLMGEISAASNEQSQGVSQVGEAVMQMDQVTHQNAALVEEMAAAASSLKSQAQELVGTVAVFKLTPGVSHAQALSPPRIATRTASKPRALYENQSSGDATRVRVSRQ